MNSAIYLYKVQAVSCAIHSESQSVCSCSLWDPITSNILGCKILAASLHDIIFVTDI